jgi:hypothetical protein
MCPTYISPLQHCGGHEDSGPASQRRSTQVARWQTLRERRCQAVSRGHRYPRWQVCSQRISVRHNLYQPVLAAFSIVTLDSCVRNFPRFTGCSLGEALMRHTLICQTSPVHAAQAKECATLGPLTKRRRVGAGPALGREAAELPGSETSAISDGTSLLWPENARKRRKVGKSESGRIPCSEGGKQMRMLFC